MSSRKSAADPTKPRPSLSGTSYRKHRYQIGERDGWNCGRPGGKKGCGKLLTRDTDLHIDHIVPVSKGGTDDISNLQLLCPECNVRWGARVEEGAAPPPAAAASPAPRRHAKLKLNLSPFMMQSLRRASEKYGIPVTRLVRDAIRRGFPKALKQRENDGH